MTVFQATADVCRKHGLCSSNGGCPLYTGSHIQDNGLVIGRYLCNEPDSQELIDKLLELGYDIIVDQISIDETDYWRMYES